MIKCLTKVSAIILLLFLLLFMYLRFTVEPLRCPLRERQFLGKKYDVARCASGGGDLYYFVRMRIYSKEGALLAQRRFTVHTAPNTAKTEYEDDKIIYNDALVNEDEGVPAVVSRVLQFPLTRRDWFEANLDRIVFSP